MEWWKFAALVASSTIAALIWQWRGGNHPRWFNIGLAVVLAVGACFGLLFVATAKGWV